MIEKLKNKFKKIKLNNIVMAIVMFIVCVSLVSVTLMQFKTVEETDITDIKNMREAELRKALAEWKSKYEETFATLEDTSKKIKEYQEKIEKNEKASELIDAELKESNIALGNVDVTGEGVIVTLKDGQNEEITAWDLIYLVNELRYAGAEAISINDIRIVNSTEIVDLAEYTYISVGTQRLEGPYYVKAIGNQTYLSSALTLKDSGYVDLYKNSGISDKQVSMETSKNIIIPKYNGHNGEMTYKYMNVEEEKK